jgi:small subunit ribosomal protein S18
MRKRRRIRKKIISRSCLFCDSGEEVNYREVEALKRYLTDRGKIIGRARSGLCRKHQRKLAVAVKRARYLALLPFLVRPK